MSFSRHSISSCNITPLILQGTPFMDRLSKCLQYYITDRLNNDAGWKGIKVCLSYLAVNPRLRRHPQLSPHPTTNIGHGKVRVFLRPNQKGIFISCKNRELKVSIAAFMRKVDGNSV